MRQYISAPLVGLALFVLLVLGGLLPAATFAAQAPQPLVSNFTVDPVGSFEKKTGNATITGSITCSQPTVIFLTLRLRQDTKRNHADNFGFADIDCRGATDWEARVIADHGRYRHGPARVDALAEWGSVEDETYSRDETAVAVRLKKSR